MIIQCKCKCGTEFEEYNKWGYKREYIFNHYRRGKYHSPETRQKMSKDRKGKHHSPETKRLMSENHADFKGENHPLWKGGVSKLPYCPIWTPWLKDEIKERDNFQCKNPGCDKEIIKNNSLCVHHIDYDKKNCSTNNLITLCRSCNTKANFNREHWKEVYLNIITN